MPDGAGPALRGYGHAGTRQSQDVRGEACAVCGGEHEWGMIGVLPPVRSHCD
jgi:hypothetical protein